MNSSEQYQKHVKLEVPSSIALEAKRICMEPNEDEISPIIEPYNVYRLDSNR